MSRSTPSVEGAAEAARPPAAGADETRELLPRDRATLVDRAADRVNLPRQLAYRIISSLNKSSLSTPTYEQGNVVFSYVCMYNVLLSKTSPHVPT